MVHGVAQAVGGEVRAGDGTWAERPDERAGDAGYGPAVLGPDDPASDPQAPEHDEPPQLSIHAADGQSDRAHARAAPAPSPRGSTGAASSSRCPPGGTARRWHRGSATGSPSTSARRSTGSPACSPRPAPSSSPPDGPPRVSIGGRPWIRGCWTS